MEVLLKKLYERMVLIRVAQEKIAELYPETEIRCPVHLCTGQEAAPVAVCSHLSKKDWIFCGHRNHGWYIAKGGDLRFLFAELYGKQSGCSKGKGGSMHLVATEVGMSLTSSIVGGTIPHAVGAALTFKKRKGDRIACACLGDGAVEEGIFFECLNFSKLYELPVLFCVENNGYSVESRVVKRRGFDLSKVCDGFDIAFETASGEDIAATTRAAQNAISKVKGRQPAVLEIHVNRFRSHVHPPDWSSHLTEKDRTERDPIMKCPDQNWLAEVFQDCEIIVEEAIRYAQSDSFPTSKELLKDVLETQ